MALPVVSAHSVALREIPLEKSQVSWATSCKVVALKVASYLTDPLCKVREYFYTFYILNETCKNTAIKVLNIALLIIGIIFFALLTPITTPLGMAVRGIVASVESKPFVYLERAKAGKVLPPNKRISLVSHNECYMPAGYSITDGQVTPPDTVRMDANIEKIKELNPDIVCLYEVEDICDASYLSSQLPEYPFIIPVAGPRAIGPSSMMYVASKYEIDESSIHFVPFVKGVELTGRARFSEKGFLSFDVRSRGDRNAFATVFSTHLQHSEIPGKPEEGEIIARAAQMSKITAQIQKKVDVGANLIFTGDLNQSEEELDSFLNQHQIKWLRRDGSVQGKPTWGGDQWCAKLMGKTVSKPQVLDFTCIAGKTKAISTQIIGTGYSTFEFRPQATSDHDLLFSTIDLG